MNNYRSFYLSTLLNGEKAFLFFLQVFSKTGSIYMSKKRIFMNFWIKMNGYSNPFNLIREVGKGAFNPCGLQGFSHLRRS